MTASTFYTYFHTRNDTGAVFYIGKGRGERLNSKYNRNPHWRNIVAKHGRVAHIAMSGLSEEDAFEHEKFLIDCFRGIGGILTNMTDGGDGCSGLVHSPESREKMSLVHRGNKHSLGVKQSQETKDKRRASLIESLSSPESRRIKSIAAMGNTNAKGKKWSDESRAKMRIAASNHSKESRERQSKSMMGNRNSFGKIPSANTRAKLSAAGMGRVISPETIAKRIATFQRNRMEGLAMCDLYDAVGLSNERPKK